MEKKNLRLSLFLSRDYSGEFFSKLEEKLSVSIDSESCISLQLKKDLKLPSADWIFFLSPSGVSLFAERFDASGFKIAVIGPGTERAVLEQNWKVDFLPQSTDPQEGIEEFAQKLSSGETVIMACSNKSLKRMHGVVPENQLIEWEFYENIPNRQISKSDAAYLIFTSPSNADGYLDLHPIENHQIAVAIGKSTYRRLDEREIENRILAKDPTEESIWEAILDQRIG